MLVPRQGGDNTLSRFILRPKRLAKTGHDRAFFVLVLSLARDCSKRVIGKYSRIFPNFQNRACCENYLKGSKHNSLHLAWKCARIFVLGHDLFLKAHSFPGATLSENCSLNGTDNVRGQITEHIFAPNGTIVYITRLPSSSPGYVLPHHMCSTN